ncbi:hypothetical protein RRG08_033397 [Elysia crispata]|uniref:Uncharacterized protein n=1 Tax=Elysia crispata TaxID=231223 RepID=A0AAE0YQX9_9GAST|nr:hypothetical protein RRG08_033397 [Elysia crispata]
MELQLYGLFMTWTVCLATNATTDTGMASTSHPVADLERLCENPASTCQERQSQRFSNFSEEDFTQGTLYVTCELMESNTACIEDLICECPGMQLADLEQQFDSVRLEYLKNCSDVEGHITRAEDIRCKDSIQESGSGNPDLGVILGEVEGELELTTSIEEMEKMCPGYTHCINISSSYNRRAERERTEFDRRILVCEGSRMNILCLEDVLCACGWSRQQVSRHTIRQLRHNHETYCDEDLTIGYLTCDVMFPTEQSGQLCLDFVNTCERRVVSRYKSLHNNTDHKYVSCETFKTRVQCFEDYVCSCPNQQTETLSQNFDSYRTPYEAQCQDAPPHRLRAGEVYCIDQVKPGQEQSGLELGVEEGAKEISLLDMARQMDQRCPGYERCFNVTAAYNHLTAQQTSLAGQLTVSCEGSRYAIICLEDALCACGWGGNSSFRSLMRDLRNQHEVTCSQDLTIGYLECAACTPNHLSWLVALATLSSLVFSALAQRL